MDRHWQIAEVDRVTVRTDPGYEGMLDIDVKRVMAGTLAATSEAALTITPRELQRLVHLAEQAGGFPPPDHD